MNSEGQSRRLDAFTVALSQAPRGNSEESRGRRKRWFASTLELQLASLEFCRACRSVPTLHVHVDAEAPISLWSTRESPAQPSADTPKRVRRSSRVAMVQALRLTWGLPVEVLMESAAKELWKCLHGLDLRGDGSSASLESLVWPRGLKRLELDYYYMFNSPITGVVWPSSLQQLSFGSHFNQPITGVMWSASLQRLTLGQSFNQPIAGVVWPLSLQQLSFGQEFNQPINTMVWPASLQQLSFCRDFNQPIVGVRWPTSLQQLSFGSKFNQPIVGVVWPASLQKLSFGRNFNQPIARVVWPASLQQLSFTGYLPIAGVVWPASLKIVTRQGISLL